MDPFDSIKATFFEECGELMESLESGLLALQSGTQDEDTVDAVFRAVHSIKGGAGAFGLNVLVKFAHEFETTLDALRSGRLDKGAPVIAVLLRSSDQLGDLVMACRTGEDMTLPDTSDLKALIDSLPVAEGNVAGGDEFNPVMLDFGLDPISGDLTPESVAMVIPIEIADHDAKSTKREGPAFGSRIWEIVFEPLPDLLNSGNEPLFLFRALEVLGKLVTKAMDGDLPTLSEMDVRTPRLRWRIELAPSAPDLTETEIESVFEFAVDLCALKISVFNHKDAEYKDDQEGMITSVAGPSSRPSEGTIGKQSSRLEAGDASILSRHSLQIPTDGAVSTSADVVPADRPNTAATQVSTTIRVDLARVDRLVNLVGELVISQSMLAQGMMRAGLDQHSEAASNLDELHQLTRDMQDSVMSIRAQPVKSLFQRMTRIVREAAQATGKQVSLVTEGEGTEIDKTVVERLADPLTHMIRNAIDHGLEAAEDRLASGKDESGIVRLTARQQSDRVIIEVSDDGRGINRTRVLERAIERGLVSEGKALEAGEIDRLLFMPGFSTIEKVSALSGRGVGMDVVQRAIRDLNGTISIVSVDGAGCTISISLPLTLAILDGMIVRSNEQRMVIPLSVIIETQTLSAARIEKVGANHKVVKLHDRFVPLIELAEGMGFANVKDTTAKEDAALLFVEPDESGPFALCVDAIEAQRQVVIKGLNENFGSVPCVSAATILGDGQVALIVDPAGIAVLSGLQHRHPTSKKEAKAS
ncbi:two-component system, chemotaxis family, sensor kinase CheA [Jannaschia faecimaris]|uniref:Chemotaxis protein CheA n=1 Tax=Jannaschia faecimaris TaxID=1244108 RepID=A0A1H3T9R3_9RHOB|nr:chemotaxis protein CheA [Jannaschia faecimaris]SDZ46608.1 two-component system, chemotaxis family, sensor kinase CheA [Jannaschia faecimaris]